MIYVIIQFTLILLMALASRISNMGIASFSFFLSSIIIGLWAIFTVGIYKVSVFPDLRKGTELVTHGPYKLVRHPMYTSVMLFCSGLVVSNPIWYMYLGFVTLFIDLVFKLRYEEKTLLKEFAEYENYKKETYYFIPFVY